MKITILLDMPDSFLHDYVAELIKELEKRGHEIYFCKNYKDITSGEIAFILGSRAILPKETLSLNKHNLVVHPSKLPEGRGSASLVWKILEGENTVYITLFEAAEKVDKGDIYYQDKIELEGHELNDETRHKQAMKTIVLVLRFIDNYPTIKGYKQTGKSTYYRIRTPEDSELNIDRTIREQFNLLRVVDNKRYPAFFRYKGHKYILKIYKEDSQDK